MNEPPRFLDEPHSALERSLLEAGRSYTASASTRRRALTALGVASLATSSTAAAASMSKAGLAKWAAVAALAGGCALAAVHYLAPSAASVPAASIASAPSTAHDGEAQVAPPTADTDSTVTGVPVVDESALPTESALPSAPVSAPRAEPKAALAAELSALDGVRSQLSAGQPKAALSSLDAYSRSFPRGRLGLEAEVLRIDALAKSGQTAAARSRAEAFIKRHPDSVLASRVRGYVGL